MQLARQKVRLHSEVTEARDSKTNCPLCNELIKTDWLKYHKKHYCSQMPLLPKKKKPVKFGLRMSDRNFGSQNFADDTSEGKFDPKPDDIILSSYEDEGISSYKFKNSTMNPIKAEMQSIMRAEKNAIAMQGAKI